MVLKTNISSSELAQFIAEKTNHGEAAVTLFSYDKDGSIMPYYNKYNAKITCKLEVIKVEGTVITYKIDFYKFSQEIDFLISRHWSIEKILDKLLVKLKDVVWDTFQKEETKETIDTMNNSRKNFCIPNVIP